MVCRNISCGHCQVALLQRSGELGALLQVTEAGEQADWQIIEAAKKALPALDLDMLNLLQVEALRWANSLYGSGDGPRGALAGVVRTDQADLSETGQKPFPGWSGADAVH